MTTLSTFEKLADNTLLAETIRLAARERLATGQLIAALAEVDARNLYLGEGCPSLFVYCTRVLHLSEHAAYARIEAARAIRRFPCILDLVVEGALTLTNITLLAPHLTEENCRAGCEAARHKSKREVEEQVAALRPLPVVAPSIRKVPERHVPDRPVTTSAVRQSDIEPSIAALASPPAKPAIVKPLAPEQYKIQFTISRGTHDKFRRVQDLLRHSIPDGDPAKIFDRALSVLLADVEKRKLASTLKPRTGAQMLTSSTRHIPAGVKREVWKRDGGQCAFIGRKGQCAERGFLEFHHREPFAAGGATTAGNLELRCRAHNMYEAELFFGPWTVREDRTEYASCTTLPDCV